MVQTPDAVGGGRGDGVEGDLPDLLSPAWRILLLSPTVRSPGTSGCSARATRTRLECTRQGPVGTFESAGGAASVPEDVALIQGEPCRGGPPPTGEDGDGDGTGTDGRDVNGGSSAPMVYAASWWSEETFKTYMTDDESPMWTNLRSQNVELYREVRRVYLGDNAALEAVFGAEGPFWGRHYIFWHEGEPMTVVYEVFNPALERQLGPSETTRAVTVGARASASVAASVRATVDIPREIFQLFAACPPPPAHALFHSKLSPKH